MLATLPLLAALAAAPPVVGALTGPVVHVRVVDQRSDPRADVIGPACKALGVRCDVEPMALTDAPELGTVSLLLTDFGPLAYGGGLVVGLTEGGGSCLPIVWSHADPVIVAHELGHALGLGHREDRLRALMHPAPIATDMTRGEKRDVRRGARELSACGDV